MNRTKNLLTVSTFVVSMGILFGGCSYTLKYGLNEKDILRANSVAPLTVHVATFTDARNSVEKEKAARKNQGFGDAGDYTYDKEFKGNVAEELSKMVVSHMKFAKSFSQIELSEYHSADISNARLDQLKRQNVDAVLVGTIEHFYGFYDRKPGKQLLYVAGLGLAVGIPVAVATASKKTSDFGSARFEEVKTNPLAIALATTAGANLGSYLESTSKRRTEAQTKLTAKLIGTTNHEILWEGTFDIHPQEHKSMPGVNTDKRKFELAVASLRDAVNAMVQSLSESSSLTRKN